MAQEKCQFLVVGPKLEALLSAYIIESLADIKVRAVVAPAKQYRPLGATMGYAGSTDNFTRISVAHGQDFAQKLWNLSLAGLAQAKDLAAELKFNHHLLEKIRVIGAEHELKEARAAEELMLGLSQMEIVDDATQDDPFRLRTERYPNFQRSSQPSGFWWNEPEVVQSLSKNLRRPALEPTDLKIAEIKSGFAVSCDGLELKSDVMLLLESERIVELVPSFASILIQVANYWVEFESYVIDQLARYTIAQHGNLWALQIGERVAFGGARYISENLADDALSKERYVSHLIKSYDSVYASRKSESQPRLIQSHSCLPCDELPVVGPHFANYRLMMASGYWGWGINFFIATITALMNDFLGGSKSDELYRRFWPERHRSL
jgi:hypothetical protein